MRRFLLPLALLALWPTLASAQIHMPRGSTPVAAATPVTCINPTTALSESCGGGLTGNVSNASSGAATSSTNIGAVSYNYGFNGTTWDQLQVDGSKNLFINCAVGCASVSSGGIGANPFTASGSGVSLSVTGSSSRVAIGTSATTLLVTNIGSSLAYCAVGNSSVVATTASIPIPAQGQQYLAQGAAVDIACITATGVTTILTTPGVTVDDNAYTALTGATPAGTNVVGGVTLYAPIASAVTGTTAAMTGTTSTVLLAAPGGALHNYLRTLVCVNSHATVGTFITIQDGSGGTALATVAGAALFGGTVVTFDPPIKQPTAATGLYVADVTTGANVICTGSGFTQ